MSLLTIIQDATDLLGLPTPNQVIGNEESDVRTLLTIANFEGDDLSRRGPWQQLETEAIFNTNLGTPNGQYTEFDLDAIAPGWDINRNPTFWDRSGQNLVNGPITPSEAQTNAAYLPLNIYYEWRFIGNKLSVYPNTAPDLTFAFEYQSKNWCQSEGGTLQSRWASDTDTARLPEFLFTLGIEWRYNQRKGFGNKWPAQKQTYDSLVMSQINAGVQGRPIDLSGQHTFRQRRVPWGDWPDYT